MPVIYRIMQECFDGRLLDVCFDSPKSTESTIDFVRRIRRNAGLDKHTSLKNHRVENKEYGIASKTLVFCR